jgi:hypothetical protein
LRAATTKQTKYDDGIIGIRLASVDRTIMTVTRRATCACGKLSIAINGDPNLVGACACTQCQRRTGSAFNVSAYFNKSQVVAIEGPHKTFQRSSDAGRNNELHFCPDCGSTLFWYSERFPDAVGTAVGCFLDPAFPKPKVFVWAAHKMDWVQLPPDIPVYADQSITR